MTTTSHGRDQRWELTGEGVGGRDPAVVVDRLQFARIDWSLGAIDEAEEIPGLSYSMLWRSKLFSAKPD